ncbi:gamma-glutamylcyclotransferase family protein [Marinobacterium lutimaris]|uniref:Uncharacterized conserved protein YtfP, gamma-glutamylcyclotransferase (GGCT)/AIG2-like family n=1 Tax=Marinobacterium lutimaris TaxID=568106 RepID=A0A1H6BY13_9GAMM|nr:gamma-glutamylcyclotransferase family protein [Marinobacterium lutimaris]SEG65589.1 Uncharacterized conserved protein YtfP, gamma-glutamylcyclotransferase (GGCT)/AIG2-like family [Marinobacterium lutimaris]
MLSKPIRKLFLALGIVTLLVPAYLWFTLLSPWGYTAPPGLAPVSAGQHSVFVYGTLRSPLVRWLVIGRNPETRTTTLTGFRKEGLDLETDSGSGVNGDLFHVSADELKRLDRYERLGIRYRRVEIELGDGSRAWVYLRIH